MNQHCPIYNYMQHHPDSGHSTVSNSSSAPPPPPQQPLKRQHDEITNLETFRAILEHEFQDDSSLKHQAPSHKVMSEDGEGPNLDLYQQD